ncbi:MAG: MFS transporter [bacterium]|nr:MFS transporter [bacterium]MDW8163932.1 MFS transporter [Candidatus Omnitrophota bacterium]
MKNKALFTILLFGIVSLFGDIVYEGVRSISGPFLASLGATAFVIGFFSGLGEFLTYSLRFFSGYISDKKKLYWPLTIIGYSLICCLPFLAFTKIWQIAILLILFERIGKAIRTPARDTLISFVGENIGYGKSFGIHEVLDQIGAFLGPLIFFYSLEKMKKFSFAFHLMWIPCFFLIFTLIFLRKNYNFDISERNPKKIKENINQSFIYYLLFVFFSICGLINFPIIAYHIKIKNVISVSKIPIFYMIAMAIDGIIAIFIGYLYDKIKLKTLLLVPILTIFLPILTLSLNIYFIIIGCHETILRASIADIITSSKRGFAYGIFNNIYGFGLFVGSSIVGFLYERNIKIIWIYTLIMETFSFVFLLLQLKKKNVMEKDRKI